MRPQTTIWLSLASLVLPGSCEQLQVQPITQPQLDLDSFNNGEFGLLGDFDSISNYAYIGMSNFTNQNTLENQLYLTTGNNDKFITLGEIRGTISSIFPFTEDSFLIQGDFQSLGNINASSPSIYNTSNNKFTALDSNNSLDGTITICFHSTEENIVYLGGNFTFNDTQSAAIFNLTSGQLQSTLFEGFGDNSQVNSIVQIGSSIVFGGKFDTLGLSQLLSSSYNLPSLTVEADQLVNLRYASFTSVSFSGDTSADGSLVKCPGSGEEWTIDSSSSAMLNIVLPYEVIPSKIRIYNSVNLDSQISLFRLVTSPTNGIMNLTYVDPDSGELAFCDAWCPLLTSTRLDDYASSTDAIDRTLQVGDSTIGWEPAYQEFGFVDSLDVSSLDFQVLASHGDNVALSGLEIYQSLFSTFALNSFNEPSCGGISNFSFADTIGDWTTSSLGSYLETTVQVSDSLAEVGVVFHPNITYAGEYSILLYTPGCNGDNTCDSRGIVNVTVIDDVTNEGLESHLIYQTNTEEKYDSIFYGHLLHSVRVEMMLYSSVLSGSDSVLTVVADRITTKVFSIDQLDNTNGSVPINAIFEYSPLNFTQFNAANLTETVLIGNTTLNVLGSNMSSDAIVQLALLNETLFVAGDFESAFGDNLFQLDIESVSSNGTTANAASLDGGLNGAVSQLKVLDDSILLLGSFDNTNNETTIESLVSAGENSLDGAALFNGSWFSFGSTTSSSSFTNLTLNGRSYWVLGDETWDATDSTWFESSNLLSFNSTTSGRTGNISLFAGSLKISETLADKGVLINSTSQASNITVDRLSQSVINIGLYVNDSLAVYGGEFVTSSNISNLVLVSGHNTDGIDVNWNQNSSVTSLFSYNDKLFVGTSGSGSVNDDDFDGVFIYNMHNRTFQSVGLLSKSTGTVQVNGFGYFNSTYLVVGGDFDQAGSVDCSGLCFYDMNQNSWTQLIDEFSGSVNSFRYVNHTVVAAGDMTYSSISLKLFAFDFNSSNQTQPSHFTDFKSEVEKFILVDDTVDGRIIVSNSTSISAYDGFSWNDITGGLEGSTISDISLLDLSDANYENNGYFFNSSQILVASGNLTIDGYGYANVAMFNSSDWFPYAVVTHGESTASVNSIFMNKDISNLFISGSISNTTHSSHPSNSSSPSSGSVVKHTSDKMDRGFIVLVGLACAVGTMGLFGSAGAFFLFRKKQHEYTPVEPRVNETEMLDTVPPENLLKHV